MPLFSAGDRIRILHVDDERDSLELVKMFLEEADPSFDVVPITSPLEALNLLEQGFDCVVSDYMMPEMNGIQFCEEVRKISKIPFFIYTGRGSEDVASAAFAVGVDDYVRKESEISHFQVLAKRIRHAVEKRRAEEALRDSNFRFETLFANSHRDSHDNASMRIMLHQKMGVIILLAFLTLDGLFYILKIDVQHESPILLSTFNLIFLTTISFIITYVAAAGYLRSGLPQLLLLGCASVAFGIFNAIVSWGALFIVAHDWTNFNVTVHNTGLLSLAAITFFGSAIFAVRRSNFSPNSRKGRPVVVSAYIMIAISVIIFGFLTLIEVVPPFVNSGGFTILRQSVLGVTVALLIGSSLLLAKMYYESKTGTLYWYSLGLALIGVGVVGILVEPNLGTPLSWTGRVAQYVGDVFLLIAVLSKSPVQASINGMVEAFRRDRLQFDLLFANMTEGFAYHKILLGENGNPIDYIYLEINNAFTRLTGLGREIIGKRATEVFPGVDKGPENLIGIVSKVAFTGQPVRVEIYSSDLKRWLSQYVYSPEKGYFATIFEDITDRKRAEAELKASYEQLSKSEEELAAANKDLRVIQVELQRYSSSLKDQVEERTREIRETRDRLEAFMNSATDLFYLFSPDLNLIDLNEAGLKMFPRRFQREEIIGKNLTELVPGMEKTERYIVFKRVLKTGQPEIMDDLKAMPIWGDIWVSINAFKVGENLGIIARDVTQRKKLEEEIRRSDEKLRKAEQMEAVSRMGAMIAHDLRNPLSNIVQAANMAKISPERADRMLKMIEDSAMRSLSMIETMRESTREITPQLNETDLAALVRKALKEMSLPKAVKVEMDLGEGLKAFMVDPDLMRRVLDNLMKNAIEAMPDGGKLKIIAEMEEDGTARIDVSDTGKEIPEEAIPKLFEPFHTTKSKGMGLGLAFCKRAVEAHGGTINFKTGAEGTVFMVRIPSQMNKL